MEMISKTDRFLKKYFNKIFVSICVIVVLVVASIVYRTCFVPREEDAAVILFHGQSYFSHQQWGKALKGDNLGYIGFLGIIDEFKGTKAANLAKAYAGICFYQLENYEEALRLLKSYRGKDQLFSAQIIGAIGDCEVNLGNIKESIAYFQKAASKAKSLYLSPIYLKKAAIVYESLKDYGSAFRIYTSIRTLYPKSPLSASIEKYIDRSKTRMKM